MRHGRIIVIVRDNISNQTCFNIDIQIPLQGLPSKARGPMMQPGSSTSAVSSGMAGVFPGGGGMASAGLWGAGGASLPGASKPSPQVIAVHQSVPAAVSLPIPLADGLFLPCIIRFRLQALQLRSHTGFGPGSFGPMGPAGPWPNQPAGAAATVPRRVRHHHVVRPRADRPSPAR